MGESMAEETREFVDLEPAQLVEEALRRGEGHLADTGALLVMTGKRTGRSPGDRFIVREASCEDAVDWGSVNRPFDDERFHMLWDRVESFVGKRDRFVSQLHVGAHEDHYLPLRIVTQWAWHGLFARNMFIQPEAFNPDRKPVWQISTRRASSVTRSGTPRTRRAVIINFARSARCCSPACATPVR
jgi:phosphoenolpyruvate carboxykinase (ATP)